MRKIVLLLLLALAGALAVPQFAGAAEYDTFVDCDAFGEGEVSPSHTCEIGDIPGAYFEADVDTEYEVCVEFPNGEEICAEEQEAEGGFLYVNAIFSESEGTHFVSWYVEDIEVGSWELNMDSPPPPAPPAPPAPAPAPPAPTPPAVAPVTTPGPSAACRKARRRVGALKGKLRKVNRSKANRRAKIKQKRRIKLKLRKARTQARRACR